MDFYQIVKPDPVLSSFISHYWVLKTSGSEEFVHRVSPTGCMQLIFYLSGRVSCGGSATFQPRSYLGGQYSIYEDMTVPGTVEIIGIIFQPFGTKAFFPFSMNSFYNSIIDIHDLDIPWLKEVEEQIHLDATNEERIRRIESYFKKALIDPDSYNLKRLYPSIQYASQEPFAQLDRMADISCLSNKQYQRLFSEYVGLNPKEFLRIIRFQRAIHMLQMHPEMKMQEIAFDCGYYDLPHLSREFKSFTGYSLKEYTSLFFPYSDYYSER